MTVTPDVTWSVAFGGLTFDATSTTYQLITAEPADVKWRRAEVTAPYVAGSTVLAQVQDVVSYRVAVRCLGGVSTNAATLANALKAASAALATSTTPTLTIVLAGASETYTAWPADITVSAD